MATRNNPIIISPVNVDSRKNLDIRAGDTVRVHQKIQEKGKTRIQIFEGLVLACKHGKEAGATITVRKVASGVGVERIFPLYSPMIENIEVVRRSKVRRSKLYFIREKVSREIKRQMRKMKLMGNSTAEADAEAEAKAVPEVADEEAAPETDSTSSPQAESESSEEASTTDTTTEEKKEDKKEE